MEFNSVKDVVVIGAGPVGLLLAGELALHGARAIVLERNTEVDRRVKAGAMHGRAAELLDRRGLTGRLTEVQRELFAGMPRPTGGGPKPRGHFAGLFALRESAFTASPAFLIPQDRLEEVLAEHAAGLGVDVRRGHALASFEQDADGVTLTVDGPDGRYGLRTPWLVGADGGRSPVRKGSGIAFPGTDGIITGYQGMVEIDDPDFVPRGWNRCPGGLMVNGPVPGRILVVEFDGPPADRDAPVTLAEVQAAVRRVTGTEVTLKSASSLTRFTDNARLADDYRAGRVLLAGDAAHVHSPFGGQGLNLGLGDAANLGWKLALVARGDAPARLLDTYTAERRPVAAQVLDNTRAQVALLQPGPHTGALREIFARMLDHDDANRYLTDLITGAGVRHDLGSARDEVGRVQPPDLTAGGRRVADLHHAGGGVLVTDDPAAAAGWADRVTAVPGPCEGIDAGTVLIRPDGVVAWATGDPGTPAEALARWFGPARVPAAAR
ncbi:FAD-dependent monooxygenase [Actinomadura macrotermitis]|uniref:Anhydrotetracycline monooxygenase n=1 Tax=Actinomadura macrotermitis TaxID=2585200 RepID=A0A7K0BW93_9ACTN|nr:FAD-dependent monooxygenase [Actinomadura macrotermitis]MQY05346.1 Anhydrotetracycline monooxygenase [Actinomadura macrotermitis]